MEGDRMRAVTAVVILLTLAAQPALSSEAFVSQVTNKAIAAGQADIAPAKSALTSAMLALPVKLNAAGLSISAPAAVPGTNTSSVVQVGANNLAAVSQTGSGNASVILQRGSGNQAIVTQRNAH
jgi:Curlin associated repeat